MVHEVLRLVSPSCDHALWLKSLSCDSHLAHVKSLGVFEEGLEWTRQVIQDFLILQPEAVLDERQSIPVTMHAHEHLHVFVGPLFRPAAISVGC
jgi:hypothetical protein